MHRALHLGHTHNLVSLFAIVARKIPFEDPEVLMYVRLGYVATQLATLAIYFYTSYKVISSSCCINILGGFNVC